MSPRLKHTTGFLTLVSIYAPRNQGVRRARLLLLGDYNFRVGSELVGYEDMVGPHSRGECSENGARLLDCWDVLPATIYTLLDLVL